MQKSHPLRRWENFKCGRLRYEGCGLDKELPDFCFYLDWNAGLEEYTEEPAVECSVYIEQVSPAVSHALRGKDGHPKTFIYRSPRYTKVFFQDEYEHLPSLADITVLGPLHELSGRDAIFYADGVNEAEEYAFRQLGWTLVHCCVFMGPNLVVTTGRSSPRPVRVGS